MKRFNWSIPTIQRFLSLVLILVVINTTLVAQKDYQDKLKETVEVLAELQDLDEANVPPTLLNRAEAIVIIPKLKKGGFVVGGKHGKGVAMVRTENGDWSDPVFVKITGGSIGFQIGFSSTDLFLIFKNANTLRRLTKNKGKFTLGGDATVAAGPVGRQASANTDLDFKAEILSYSKSRGVFAGISLEGSDLRMDSGLNEDCYGSPQKASRILERGRSGVVDLKAIHALKMELQQLAR